MYSHLPYWQHQPAFDKQVSDTAVKILKLPPLSIQQQQQFQLKLINSGFGLNSVEKNSPIAYISGIAAVTHVLCECKIAPDGKLPAGTNFAADYVSALHDTRTAVGDHKDSQILLPPISSDPQSIAHFAGFPEGKRFQRTLSHVADTIRFSRLCDGASPMERARLLSCSGAYSSAWLTTIPTDMRCRMPARHYRIAARVRLGLAPFDNQYKQCVCLSPNADPKIDIHHGFSCFRVRRTYVNKRHDNVKNLVHYWAKQVGCAAVKEPQNVAGSQERADNQIDDPDGRRYLCDVSIVQPACPTHVSKAQQRLGTAKFAAIEKHIQYDAMAFADGAEMWPLIAEVYGSLEDDFVAFIKRMAFFASDGINSQWSRAEALSQMIGSIAVAIQIGNVKVFSM